MGHAHQAFALLQGLVGEFGDGIRHGLLQDFEMHPFQRMRAAIA
jgi:hypothetical protein